MVFWSAVQVFWYISKLRRNIICSWSWTFTSDIENLSVFLRFTKTPLRSHQNSFKLISSRSWYCFRLNFFILIYFWCYLDRSFINITKFIFWIICTLYLIINKYLVLESILVLIEILHL